MQNNKDCIFYCDLVCCFSSNKKSAKKEKKEKKEIIPRDHACDLQGEKKKKKRKGKWGD